jgi:hypothetical protein
MSLAPRPLLRRGFRGGRRPGGTAPPTGGLGFLPGARVILFLVSPAAGCGFLPGACALPHRQPRVPLRHHLRPPPSGARSPRWSSPPGPQARAISSSASQTGAHHEGKHARESDIPCNSSPCQSRGSRPLGLWALAGPGDDGRRRAGPEDDGRRRAWPAAGTGSPGRAVGRPAAGRTGGRRPAAGRTRGRWLAARGAVVRRPAARGAGGAQAHARARREEQYDGRRRQQSEGFFLSRTERTHGGVGARGGGETGLATITFGFF